MATIRPKGARFGMVPISLLGDSRLTNLDKLVFCALAAHDNAKTGKCNPGQALIAEMLGVHRQAVNRSIQNLVRYRYVEVVGGGKSGSKAHYTLHWQPMAGETLSGHIGETPDGHRGETLRGHEVQQDEDSGCLLDDSGGETPPNARITNINSRISASQRGKSPSLPTNKGKATEVNNREITEGKNTLWRSSSSTENKKVTKTTKVTATKKNAKKMDAKKMDARFEAAQELNSFVATFALENQCGELTDQEHYDEQWNVFVEIYSATQILPTVEEARTLAELLQRHALMILPVETILEKLKAKIERDEPVVSPYKYVDRAIRNAMEEIYGEAI